MGHFILFNLFLLLDVNCVFNSLYLDHICLSRFQQFSTFFIHVLNPFAFNVIMLQFFCYFTIILYILMSFLFLYSSNTVLFLLYRSFLTYWVDQKCHLTFSIRCYRETQMNFMASPISFESSYYPIYNFFLL